MCDRRRGCTTPAAERMGAAPLPGATGGALRGRLGCRRNLGRDDDLHRRAIRVAHPHARFVRQRMGRRGRGARLGHPLRHGVEVVGIGAEAQVLELLAARPLVDRRPAVRMSGACKGRRGRRLPARPVRTRRRNRPRPLRSGTLKTKRCSECTAVVSFLRSGTGVDPSIFAILLASAVLGCGGIVVACRAALRIGSAPHSYYGLPTAPCNQPCARRH